MWEKARLETIWLEIPAEADDKLRKKYNPIPPVGLTHGNIKDLEQATYQVVLSINFIQ